MTVTFEIAQPISSFIVTIEIAESNDVVNVKSFANDCLSNAATLAGVIIPCPGVSGLPLPVLSIIGGMAATPSGVTGSAPVIRFPISEALAIAIGYTTSFKFPLRSFQDFPAPIAIYLLLIVSGVVLTSCAFTCKRATVTTFSNPKLVASQLAGMATIQPVSFGFLHIFNLSATLTNTLKLTSRIRVVTFLTAKLLGACMRLKNNATLNTGYNRQELSFHPVIIARLFGYVKQCGSGTVGAVCREHGRRFIGIDLSARYLAENALPRSERKTSSASIKTLPMFADLDEAA